MIKENNIDVYRITDVPTNILIESFDCGDSRLNDFFANEALALDQENYLATTVLLDSNSSIVGFFTTSASKLEVEPMSNLLPVPVVRETMSEYAAIKIDYFAISKDFQNMGLGKDMMRLLLNGLIQADSRYGVGFKVVFLEALSNAMDFYESIGFSYLKPWESENLNLSSAVMIINHESLIRYYN